MQHRSSLAVGARTAASALALGTALTIGGGLLGSAAPGAYLPEASAQSCSTPHQRLQGQLDWAVKDSFLNYIKGPIAKGSWTTRGAKDNGSGFSFTVSKGYVDAEGLGFAAGTGNVTFTGHGGLLKTSISDPTLKFTGGNTAQLLVIMSSQDADGNEIQGLDGWVHLADVTFTSPVTGGGNYIGTPILTSTGAAAFADFYDEGTELADINLSVQAAQSCGSLPTLDGLDSVSTNTPAATPRPHKPANGNSGASGAKPAPAGRPASGTKPAPAAGGKAGAAPARTQSGGSKGGASTPQAATGGGSGSGAAEQCTAVTSSQISWGVKQSFRTYISGSIAKGGWEGDGVGDSGNAFVFSGGSGSVDANSKVGSVNTSGTLRFYGHNGKLNLVISNLRATFSGSSGQLIADVQSSDVEGTPKNFGTVALGDLSYSSLDVSSSSVSGSAEVSLTAAGADAFAGFYEPGTRLDPISISASLSGSADCAGATSGASSASDGTAAAASGAAAALKGGGGSGSGSSAGGAKSGQGANASNGDAKSKFGQKGSGLLSFHNGEGEDDGSGILSAGLSGANMGPVQLIAVLAVFGIAAASCLTLSYKRKPLSLAEVE
ncbi:hypothetical protein F7230_08420 [Corynebacterium sp. 320]|uniref:HtaA domain-containing protein n=1 Tax=Corynebacterium TaxID=1716 RepID=UPI00125CC3C6|nr:MULTISPECIES: HtaA domain-containing protein [Corynebacterium]KAB1502451.1 hypothetical protein F7230_08420 [Corynebacterium sp. 320]KAB1551328.1 hypothetical protein F7233_07360 [Corynebacterium sp. 321]KAB1551844.1 hypothetical protein F7232_06910 [Corynebacterium sp. 319]KAB3526058.1 hypothetical protein F8354_08420 [Corynebacterium sp. 250]KAB3538838.1 hypothetical protein F8390_07490 [Corynebacterium sp. 366]